MRRSACLSFLVSGLLLAPASGQEDTTSQGARADTYRVQESLRLFGVQAQTRVMTTGVVTLRRTKRGKAMNYELRVKGAVRVGYERQKVSSFIYGPYQITRDLGTQRVQADGPELKLAVTVMNTVVGRSSRQERREAEWDDDSVKLGDYTEYFPIGTLIKMQVKRHYDSSVEDDELFLITAESSSFKVTSLPDEPGPRAQGATREQVECRLKAVYVMSFKNELLYQATTTFVAIRGRDTLRIERVQFLTNGEGQPTAELVDERARLEHFDKPVMLSQETPLPVWALQAVKAFQMMSTGCLTAAEQGTNPGPVAVSLPGLLLTDTAVAVSCSVLEGPRYPAQLLIGRLTREVQGEPKTKPKAAAVCDLIAHGTYVGCHLLPPRPLSRIPRGIVNGWFRRASNTVVDGLR